MPPFRIVAWADADQEPLLREALANESLHLVAVGSEEADQAARLGSALKCDRVDDLRRAILHDDADALWLAAPTELDTSTLKLMRERSLRIISAQPHPGAVADLNPAEDGSLVRFAPAMRRSAGYRAALDVLSDFGEVRCLNITARSGVGQGNLFARLFDAVDIVENLCGEPEIIDAALVGPVPGVAERLSGLHGHMTINLRFPENRCACLAVSDRAGSWFRGVTVLGEGGGCLRISDDDFQWVGERGELIDSHESSQPTTPGGLVAAQIVRMLESLDTTDAPPDAARLLAVCEAARLSCRTGQGETPRKVMKMLKHV